MSKKHQQRTRAEILAKRAKPIEEVRVQKKIITPNGPIWVAQPTQSERLRSAFDASKYMPHFGAKQIAKLAPRGLLTAPATGERRSTRSKRLEEAATHG